MAKADLRVCQVCGMRRDYSSMRKMYNNRYACHTFFKKCSSIAQEAINRNMAVNKWLEVREEVLRNEPVQPKEPSAFDRYIWSNLIKLIWPIFKLTAIAMTYSYSVYGSVDVEALSGIDYAAIIIIYFALYRIFRSKKKKSS